MALPTFFIAGAAKSGTTSLHEYLALSPDIYMSEIKEPHFFSHDEYYQKGLQWYENLFEKGKTYLHRGESSTGYMVFDNTIARIAKLIQSPKFIFVLRNPVDRAYSHYQYLKGMGFESRSFREAFCADMHDVPASSNRAGVSYRYYYQFGCYGSLIEKFVQQFGRNNIHILTTERLKREPLESVNACLEFLGVPPLSEVKIIQANQTHDVRYKKAFRCFLAGRKMIAKVPIKKLIPLAMQELYSNMAKKITSSFMSSGKAIHSDKISSSDRLFVSNLYHDEMIKLRAIAGTSFEEWQDDFRL